MSRSRWYVRRNHDSDHAWNGRLFAARARAHRQDTLDGEFEYQDTYTARYTDRPGVLDYTD